MGQQRGERVSTGLVRLIPPSWYQRLSLGRRAGGGRVDIAQGPTGVGQLNWKWG